MNFTTLWEEVLHRPLLAQPETNSSNEETPLHFVISSEDLAMNLSSDEKFPS
jgi:hypothetical protein